MGFRGCEQRGRPTNYRSKCFRRFICIKQLILLGLCWEQGRNKFIHTCPESFLTHGGMWRNTKKNGYFLGRSGYCEYYRTSKYGRHKTAACFEFWWGHFQAVLYVINRRNVKQKVILIKLGISELLHGIYSIVRSCLPQRFWVKLMWRFIAVWEGNCTLYNTVTLQWLILMMV